MHLDVRGVGSPQVEELFITATPTPGVSLAEQGREIFVGIRELLKKKGAWIAQERIFAPQACLADLRSIRASVYGDLDDGVLPSWLVSVGQEDRIAGVQVYAIRGLTPPRPLRAGAAFHGRTFECNGNRWVTGSGMTAADVADAPAQAREVFENAQTMLKQAGTDMRSVARTWIFMDRILEWYGPFNQARTGFFIEHGVIDRSRNENRMPASTGIGVSPAGSARCLLDLYAAVGPDGTIQRYHEAGKQRSALEYGSAFARASQIKSPAGQIVFVSGTAAIDPLGETCHLGDASGQIQMTLENVTAVLRQMNCGPRDVVQTMVYCATAEVKELFESCWAELLPWPWVTLIGDVCRPDLLFEVEATACPGAKSL